MRRGRTAREKNFQVSVRAERVRRAARIVHERSERDRLGHDVRVSEDRVFAAVMDITYAMTPALIADHGHETRSEPAGSLPEARDT